MKSHAILTAIGTDRVGIVDDLTAAILRRECNVEESRMAVLGGEFAVILLLSGSREGVEALMRELPEEGERLGLHVSLKRTVAPHPAAADRPYTLESVSLDTPGIVHSITALLRRHGVNIVDLETDTTPAPWTGAPMFVMRARLTVPQQVAVTRLREELEELEIEQHLDVKLNPATAAPAEY